MKHKNKSKPPTQALTPEQQQLVLRHLPLADNLSKKYAALGRSRGIPIDDLRQEASLGLCHAALQWDHTRTATFQTYAFLWCRKMILLAISHGNTYTSTYSDIPCDIGDEADTDSTERIHQLHRRMQRLTDRQCQVISLFHGLDTEPMTWKQIAHVMNITPARCHQIYNQAINILSY